MDSNNSAGAASYLTPTSWKAAGVGALGAFVGFMVASLVLAPFFGDDSQLSMGGIMLYQALLFGIPGAVISEFLLAYDNQASLRGRWDRDLWRGLAIFVPLSFVSGGVAQFVYSLTGFSRSIPWVVVGGGIGAGIGMLRQDKLQAQRGALGGAIGGLLGGVLVDIFMKVFTTPESLGNATMIGMVLTGGAIALGMRVTQDALKNAWLLGVSTGVYEGKEYPLNTGRISVGRSELNDISLFRENAMPEQLGNIVWQGDSWHWSGTPVPVNGVFQSQAVLGPGDTIQLGSAQFRFQSRSMRSPVAPYQQSAPVTPSGWINSAAPNASVAPGYPLPTPAPSWTPAPPSPQSSAPRPPSAPTVNLAAPSWTLQGMPTVRLPAAPASLQFGRAATNDIVVNEGSVSSRHALIELSADTLTITDLNSTNGTFVNGVRLVGSIPVSIRSGDKLKFGAAEYAVERA